MSYDIARAVATAPAVASWVDDSATCLKEKL
jgi:hypothetical protein